MSLWKWIKVYFQGYTVLIATAEKHYRVVWFKGNVRMTTEIPEYRGLSYDTIWMDESPQPSEEAEHDRD